MNKFKMYMKIVSRLQLIQIISLEDFPNNEKKELYYTYIEDIVFYISNMNGDYSSFILNLNKLHEFKFNKGALLKNKNFNEVLNSVFLTFDNTSSKGHLSYFNEAIDLVKTIMSKIEGSDFKSSRSECLTLMKDLSSIQHGFVFFNINEDQISELDRDQKNLLLNIQKKAEVLIGCLSLSEQINTGIITSKINEVHQLLSDYER